MKKLDPALLERLEMLIRSMGYEMVGHELLTLGRQMLFRLYIDRSGGLTLDDCAKVSHQVSAMLDVLDPVKERYLLEVSSPGIDRPLFDVAHFRQYIGRAVRIRLYLPINERRNYKGVLKGVEGEDIYLLVNDELEHEVKLPFSNIEKANLIG